MHELAIMENILETALHHAQSAGTARITDLYLVLGQLSSVGEDSAQFYWNTISQNTLAGGAQLHFRHISAELLCMNCQSRFPYTEAICVCPACGSEKVRIASGGEFYLESIAIVPEDGDMQAGVGRLDP